jgi:hypothetical protein
MGTEKLVENVRAPEDKQRVGLGWDCVIDGAD